MGVNIRDCGELGIHLRQIANKLFKNQNLIKLLYYTDEQPLSHPDWSLAELEQLKPLIFEKLIKLVPKVKPEDDKSIISIQIINGYTNSSNDEFRNIGIGIEVFCPFKTWFISDTNLRMFAIMGEIQKSLRNKKVNGLGKIQGGDFELEFLTEEIAAYKMAFSVIDYD